MLVPVKADDLENVVHRKQRQHLLVFFFVFVLFLIQHRKAVKLHRIARCLEQASCGINVHRNGIEQCICHLACGKSAPDEAIESVLLLSQILAHKLGCEVYVGGTDGLVSVLSAGLGLEASGAAVVILGAVVAGNKGSGSMD